MQDVRSAICDMGYGIWDLMIRNSEFGIKPFSIRIPNSEIQNWKRLMNVSAIEKN